MTKTVGRSLKASMTSPDRQIARDISYAHSAQTRGGRAVIRALENTTGRLGLIRRADGYQAEITQGADFWQVMVNRYGLSLDITGGALASLPKDGPVVVVANHPYGILDGLMMGHILSTVRPGNFRILAHNVFRRATDLDRVILPISFDKTRGARSQNVKTRKAALAFLAGGGAIGVFPGGTVSTGAKPFSRPLDPGWRSFTAKMVATSNATVVSIYFEGENSRLFQIASHLHSTLRVALLIREFNRRTDAPVKVVIGDPVPTDEIDTRRKDARALMDFLRASTYALSPEGPRTDDYGFEFDAMHKKDRSHGGRDT